MRESKEFEVEVFKDLHQFRAVNPYVIACVATRHQLSMAVVGIFRKQVNDMIPLAFASDAKVKNARNNLILYATDRMGASYDPVKGLASCDVRKTLRLILVHALPYLQKKSTMEGDREVWLVNLKVTADATTSYGNVLHLVVGAFQLLFSKVVNQHPDAFREDGSPNPDAPWKGDYNSRRNCIPVFTWQGTDDQDTCQEMLLDFYRSLAVVEDRELFVVSGTYVRFRFIHGCDMKMLGALLGIACLSSWCMLCMRPTAILNKAKEACPCCVSHGFAAACHHETIFDKSELRQVPKPIGYAPEIHNTGAYPLDGQFAHMKDAPMKKVLVSLGLELPRMDTNLRRQRLVKHWEQNGISLFLEEQDDGVEPYHIDTPGNDHRIRWNLSLRFPPDAVDDLSIFDAKVLLHLSLNYELAQARLVVGNVAALIKPYAVAPCSLHGEARTSELLFRHLNRFTMMYRPDNDNPTIGLSAIIAKVDRHFSDNVLKCTDHIVAKTEEGNVLKMKSLDFARLQRCTRNYAEFLLVYFPVTAERNQKRWLDYTEDERRSGAIPKKNCYQDFLKLFELFCDMWHQIGYMGTWDDERLRRLMTTITAFFLVFVFMFGEEAISPYMHWLRSGHVCSFIKRFGPLHGLNQQGLEHLMARVKGVVHRKSNRGVTGPKLPAAILNDLMLDSVYRLHAGEKSKTNDIPIVPHGEGIMCEDFTKWLEAHEASLLEREGTGNLLVEAMARNYEEGTNVYDPNDFDEVGDLIDPMGL